MMVLSSDMEDAHTVQQYRAIYKYHKAHPKNQQFAEENHKNLVVYAVAAKAIPERYCSLPNTKKLSRLDDLAQKKRPDVPLREQQGAFCRTGSLPPELQRWD